VVLGRDRQLGRGMRSARRARRLCQGIPILGLAQTNHQQILEQKMNPSGLLFLFFKLFILNVYLTIFFEIVVVNKEIRFFF